jgi:ubiquitin thioesterase OTU1
MRLRIRGPNGIFNVGESLSEESTLGELKIEIQNLTNIKVEDQCLKANFPPTAITNPNNSTLIESGISDGDQIILIESIGFGQPISAPTKTENIPTSTSNPPEPEPLPHNVKPEASSSSTPPIHNVEPTNIETSNSNNDNNSNNIINNNNNNNAELPSKYYPSTSKGRAVETRDGILIIKEIPDDNSCLFNSVRYVTQNKHLDIAHLRKIIGDSIRNDPINFNDAILGKPVEEYINYIQKPLTWGGYIELLIFSDYFKIEICSIDVKTNRIDRYGEGKYKEMVFIVYNGIHYDAVALKPFEEAPEEYERTIFDSNDNYLIGALKALGENLRKNNLFTDTANFKLRCGVCNTALVGEKEAIEHANKTGHTDFREY